MKKKSSGHEIECGEQSVAYWPRFSHQVVTRLEKYAHFYRLWWAEVTQQVVKSVLAPFPAEWNEGGVREGPGAYTQDYRRHLRFLHLPIVVEVGLPEACSSITGGQGRETVCVDLNGQRADRRPVLLIDALSCRQADDSGSNDCHTHLWQNMLTWVGWWSLGPSRSRWSSASIQSHWTSVLSLEVRLLQFEAGSVLLDRSASAHTRECVERNTAKTGCRLKCDCK